eukprot:1675910-Pyramimonas_sp.AAC.1
MGSDYAGRGRGRRRPTRPLLGHPEARAEPHGGGPPSRCDQGDYEPRGGQPVVSLAHVDFIRSAQQASAPRGGL